MAEDLANELRTGKKVVVHCHGGIGRSSLMAACTLVTLGLTAAEAMRRISVARGFSVPETPAQIEWVYGFAQHWRAGSGPP